jgi:hypothetical protein
MCTRAESDRPAGSSSSDAVQHNRQHIAPIDDTNWLGGQHVEQLWALHCWHHIPSLQAP